MAHTYPVGAAATSYGVDMATLTWQFLHTAWSG
jgi:hypothetical protein